MCTLKEDNSQLGENLNPLYILDYLGSDQMIFVPKAGLPLILHIIIVGW